MQRFLCSVFTIFKTFQEVARDHHKRIAVPKLPMLQYACLFLHEYSNTFRLAEKPEHFSVNGVCLSFAHSTLNTLQNCAFLFPKLYIPILSPVLRYAERLWHFSYDCIEVKRRLLESSFLQHSFSNMDISVPKDIVDNCFLM